MKVSTDKGMEDEQAEEPGAGMDQPVPGSQKSSEKALTKQEKRNHSSVL